MNSDKAILSAMMALNASVSSLHRSSGSFPSAIKLNPILTPSLISGRQFSRAFHAAFCPAISPSKQKTIFLLYLKSLLI